MENIKQEELVSAPTSEATTETVETTESTTQDPLKVELDRVQGKKTEPEKAAFSLRKNAERAKELGIDIAEVLGLKTAVTGQEQEENDDDKPVTWREYRQMQSITATKNAVQLADEITDPTERELTKYHIENSIRSTGNPKEDLELARAIVNSKKNSQILQMATMKPAARTAVSTGGAPKEGEVQVDYTPEEQLMMRPPFNLTREDILKSRPKA